MPGCGIQPSISLSALLPAAQPRCAAVTLDFPRAVGAVGFVGFVDFRSAGSSTSAPLKRAGSLRMDRAVGWTLALPIRYSAAFP